MVDQEPQGQPPQDLVERVPFALQSEEFRTAFSQKSAKERTDILLQIQQQLAALKGVHRLKIAQGGEPNKNTHPELAIAAKFREGRYINVESMRNSEVPRMQPTKYQRFIRDYAIHIYEWGQESIAHLCPDWDLFWLRKGVFLTDSGNTRKVEFNTIEELRGLLKLGKSTRLSITRNDPRDWIPGTIKVPGLMAKIEAKITAWDAIPEHPPTA